MPYRIPLDHGTPSNPATRMDIWDQMLKVHAFPPSPVSMCRRVPGKSKQTQGRFIGIIHAGLKLNKTGYLLHGKVVDDIRFVRARLCVKQHEPMVILLCINHHFRSRDG